MQLLKQKQTKQKQTKQNKKTDGKKYLENWMEKIKHLDLKKSAPPKQKKSNLKLGIEWNFLNMIICTNSDTFFSELRTR